ncbi:MULTISPECIES: hypothetical protein [Shouchella]|uniref:YtxH domain-containing protein n=2 Tax=Shouchella TaxID=2893057 RepID=A0ABY7W949_9BACI|nr:MULTISPECIES: hypothetical protein [Shouchella]MED4127625.1 hypothetical protein [Shouchella miscanthi]WDF04063.1 hypothetical protein PQ477_00880 [Shouchella hunanensis]GAF22431.1 hypothetical protein JCM19047_2182 [Bacillus sp. JCM 19047]
MDAKKTVVAVASAAVAGALTVYLVDGDKRAELKEKGTDFLNKVTGKTKEEKIKAFQLGNPRPFSEDSKMVDEGSLYSVQRYNERYQ